MTWPRASLARSNAAPSAPALSPLCADRATPPARQARISWLALLAVWVVSAVYVFHYLPHGWVPHDEGALAQSAQRVLAGELPHRDFTEIYTGGLSYLNAAAFHWLGTNLLSLRLALFAVFLLWVPSLYYIATRLASPLAAAAVVALGVAWSVPNYSAAMPSWYNLFLATFGIAALFRHLETEKQRWLVLAGICGGLSFLIKSVGLYYIAGVLLYFVYRAQCVSRMNAHESAVTRDAAYRACSTAALLCFVAALAVLVHRRLGIPEFVHFIAPGSALAAFLLWQEWTTPLSLDAPRFHTLLRLAGPFLLGVCAPVALFLVPYAASGSVTAFIDGVFITPMKRFDFAQMRPPGGLQLLIAIPTAVVLGFVPPWRPTLDRVLIASLALPAFALLAGIDSRLYRLIWDSMRMLGPLTVFAGVWLLARHGERLTPQRRQQLVMLLSITALCSLVQFPFSAPVYFFYSAPLIVLAGLAIVSSQPRAPRMAPALALGFYLLFAVVRIHPGFIYAMGIAYSRDNQTQPLASDRGGILVTAADNSTYTQLVAELRAHASGGYTYATPDCPEVYFLAGLRNPTRTLFDFFDEPRGRTARVLRAIDARHVTAIVLNDAPSFSGPIPPALRAELMERYPYYQRIGHFVIRWRE